MLGHKVAGDLCALCEADDRRWITVTTRFLMSLSVCFSRATPDTPRTEQDFNAFGCVHRRAVWDAFHSIAHFGDCMETVLEKFAWHKAESTKKQQEQPQTGRKR